MLHDLQGLVYSRKTSNMLCPLNTRSFQKSSTAAYLQLEHLTQRLPKLTSFCRGHEHLARPHDTHPHHIAKHNIADQPENPQPNPATSFQQYQARKTKTYGHSAIHRESLKQ